MPSSQYLVGAMYVRGEGVTVDNEEARKWFRKDAGKGGSQSPVFTGADL